MNVKAVFVPFPFTLLSAVGFLLYEEVGILDKDCIVLQHGIKSFEPNNTGFEIQHLFGKDFLKSLQNLVKGNQLRRFFNYALECETKEGRRSMLKYGRGTLTVFNIYLNILAENHQNVEAGFKKTVNFLKHLLYENIDPTRMTDFIDEGKTKITLDVSRRALYGGKIYFTLPVLKKEDGPGGQDIIDSADKILFEKEALTLINGPVILAVVGPPNSGKSSFVASLAREMRNVLDSLATRGFPTIRVKAIDMDIASSTLKTIYNKKVGRKKQSWSWDLTKEGIRSCKDTIQNGADVILLDLPGKATDFTRAIAGIADCGIIISNTWEEIPEVWRPLLKESGAREIGHFKSRTLREIGPLGMAYTSLITNYWPNRMITGRIVGLERVIGHCCDLVVWVGARILLFDLLPGIIRKKQMLMREVLDNMK